MHPFVLPSRSGARRLTGVLCLVSVLASAQAQQYPYTTGAQAVGRGVGGGTLPTITEPQMYRFTKELNTDFLIPNLAVTNARSTLAAASLTLPRNDAAIAKGAADLAAAELALAQLRADAFARIQGSPDRLTREQVALIVANGGRYTSPGFNASGVINPMDFKDHEGYVPIFDGVSLKGWDGNPKFWRVEDGAIVGESTPTNPSGNSYIVYREVEAHDFDLKFEIKVEGNGGSGLQYRSKTGIPWLAGVGDNVTRNVGALNLNWMQTGPQADFWPTQVHTGQFYSENTPMRILARRGLVLETFGNSRKRIMGSVGDSAELQSLVKMNDWNEFTVIARGGVFVHILNGHVMAVMIDDDPQSSNNWSGQFGIEIEQTTKISVRNLWLKKLN